MIFNQRLEVFLLYKKLYYVKKFNVCCYFFLSWFGHRVGSEIERVMIVF